MSPGGVINLQLCVGNMAGLDFIVSGSEIQITVAGDNDGARPDRRQGQLEITVVERVVADIAPLPGFELAEQIVGVPGQVVRLPVLQQRLGGVETQLPEQFLPVERLGKRPAGVDAGKGFQPGHRGNRIVSPVEVLVSRQCSLHPLQENPVVNRCPGGTAKRQDRPHLVRVLSAPLIRLAASHRPARHQRDLLYIELFLKQSVLSINIVIQRDGREAGAVMGWRGIAWRGGITVTEQVDRDNEMPVRVDRPALPEKSFVADMRPGIESRQHHHIVLCGVQFTIGPVDQPGRRQRDPALQFKIVDGERLCDMIHNESYLQVYKYRIICGLLSYNRH